MRLGEQTALADGEKATDTCEGVSRFSMDAKASIYSA